VDSFPGWTKDFSATYEIQRRHTMLGIVGYGIIGYAVAAGFYGHYRLCRYDTDPTKSEFPSVGDMMAVLRHGPVFVCVPTSMNPDGSCDTLIVHKVCAQLNAHSLPTARRTVLLKSTVPPGTTDALNAKYRNLDVVFNPEFSSAKTAVKEFLDQKHVLLGGMLDEGMRTAKTIYSKAFPFAAICVDEAKVMEMVKMATNAFFATKVAFANEIRQICDATQINYARTISVACLDSRMGDTHWDVPGHDGELGFGGACLPKDINSLIHEARKLGVDPRILLAAWAKNIEVRETLGKELAECTTASPGVSSSPAIR